MLNCFLKEGVNEEKLSSWALLAHASAEGCKFCPVFHNLCLADSSYEFIVLKDRALLRLQIQNLLLPGSLFCHFPHLDSMIHTLETEHGVTLTAQKCLLLMWLSLLIDLCVKQIQSTFLSRSCVYLKLSLLLWQQHIYLKWLKATFIW